MRYFEGKGVIFSPFLLLCSPTAAFDGEDGSGSSLREILTVVVLL